MNQKKLNEIIENIIKQEEENHSEFIQEERSHHAGFLQGVITVKNSLGIKAIKETIEQPSLEEQAVKGIIAIREYCRTINSSCDGCAIDNWCGSKNSTPEEWKM